MNIPSLCIKKFLFVPLIIVMLFFSFCTQNVQAQVTGVPVGDPTSWLTTIGEFAAKKSFDIATKIAEMSADSAAYALGQMLLDQVTENIVSWIKGGFNGSPSFAVDPNRLFLDSANMVSGGLSREILNLSVCKFDNFFNANLSNMVNLSTGSASAAASKLANQMNCPYPQNVKASDFFNDFSKGGWSSFETSLKDTGNPFGITIMTAQELDTRQAKAQDIKKQELSWGNGFMSMTDTSNCDYPPEVNLAMTATITANDTGIASPDAQPPEWVAAVQSTYCKRTTPGKVVGDRLQQAIGVDTSKLGFVDNVNKIIGAVITQLTTQVSSGIFK